MGQWPALASRELDVKARPNEASTSNRLRGDPLPEIFKSRAEASAAGTSRQTYRVTALRELIRNWVCRNRFSKRALLLVSSALLWTSDKAIACEQWDIGFQGVPILIQQANGFTVNAQLHQDGSGFAGNAATSGSNGTVTGTLVGNQIDMKINWIGHYSIGIYQGTVDSDGRAEGQTWEAATPQRKYAWYTDRPIHCTNDGSVHVPYAPLRVDAFVRPKQNRVVVTWEAPDLSGNRPIVRFEIERTPLQDLHQSGTGAIVFEGQIPGPNFNQPHAGWDAGSADAALTSSFLSSALTNPTAWAFRVCSANSAGRTCASPFVQVHEKPFDVYSRASSDHPPLPRSGRVREAQRTNTREYAPVLAEPNATRRIPYPSGNRYVEPPRQGMPGESPARGPVVGEPGGFAGPAPTMTGTFGTDFGELILGTKEGNYGASNGSVSVERIYGNFMDGTWRQSQAAQLCADGTYRGHFHFQFNAKGFAGSYGYCDGPVNAGHWNGTRQ
jgi:hypothetical protein